MKYFASVIIFALISSGCFDFHRNVNYPDYQMQKVWGSKPVYTADTSYRIVHYVDSALPVVNAGKIYVKDNLIYQCETGKGIHIINNSVPATAKRIAFLAIKGCEEIAIKNNYLYTNNYYDLVTIDIANPKNIHVIARTPNAFRATASTAELHTWEMPEDSGYFECPQFYTDSVISGWVKDSIYQGCYK